MKLVFEKGHEGRKMEIIAPLDVPEAELGESFKRAAKPKLPRCRRRKSAVTTRSWQSATMGSTTGFIRWAPVR